MRNKIYADELIKDLTRRRDEIEKDEENFNSNMGEAMKVGAIMALNQAIDLVKKLAIRTK